ncbi:MAG: molybdopterin cofactor-binding domain-containing protein [Thermodesulfobacteriota bacterium]
MKKRGIGVGCMYYGLGYGYSRPDFASATIEICQDGSVIVRTGQVDYGQGSDAIFCQIAAEELGVKYENVTIIAADTATTPDSGPTSASRLVYVGGNAVIKACAALKKTLQAVARALLEAEKEEDVVMARNEVYDRNRPENKISFARLAMACHQRGVQIVETGWYDNMTPDVDPETGQGDAYAAYCWAAQLAEVEVDTDTGQVEVLRLIAAHDVGKAINPCAVEGQIEGGVVMGLGYALTEEVKSAGGYIKTRTLGEYTVPTSLDVPEIEPHIVEVPTPGGPYGAKGLGEPALIPTAPAVINAICNALEVQITDMPANLENVFRVMQARDRTGRGREI